jgi:hypothetical protein
MIITDSLRDKALDPAALDRCLACEQHVRLKEALDAGMTFTLDEFRDMLDLAGRNAQPWLLLDARCFSLITNETIAAIVSDVWSSAEYPAGPYDPSELA